MRDRKSLAAYRLLWTSWNPFGIYPRENVTISKEFNIDPQWVNPSYPNLPGSLFDAPHSTAYPHDMEGKAYLKQLDYLHCWL